MAAAIEIRRRDLTTSDLRRAAGQTKDGRVARRILSIALAMEGLDRKTSAESCGMDRQTLRDWVHRYNAEGLAGLENRGGSGRKPRLTPEQQAELAAWMEAGPDPETDGVVRLALHRPQAADRGAVRGGSPRTHGGQAPGGTRLSPSLGPPAASEGRPRGAGGIQKNFRESVTEALPEVARGKPLEIWFQE